METLKEKLIKLADGMQQIRLFLTPQVSEGIINLLNSSNTDAKLDWILIVAKAIKPEMTKEDLSKLLTSLSQNMGDLKTSIDSGEFESWEKTFRWLSNRYILLAMIQGWINVAHNG